MIAYATVTGTLANVADLRAANWGWLFSAAGWLPSHDWVAKSGISECIGDSGAWHYHQAGKPFNFAAYRKLLAWIQPLQPRFVMLPDRVGEGAESLTMSLHWEGTVREMGMTPALVVQDGMDPDEILPLVSPDLALCVGGSTEWKERTMGIWCRGANERGAWSHVLRVNTKRRIHLCEAAGAGGFDGTSASKFRKTLPMLETARRQRDFEGTMSRTAA